MRIYIYLYLLKLIAHTETVRNPKTVNVQLETVLEFNDKDNEADVKFIGNIQKILKKVKTALRPKTGRRSLSNIYNNNDQHIQFTDFIVAAVDILLSYDDDDLKHAFSTLDDEIRKYHYKGCKFYELVEDENIREYIARNLENLKRKKARALRKKLNEVTNIIGNAKLISRNKKFLDYINSLYRQESSKMFLNILQNLENYSYKSKRSNMNFIEITRHGIRSVLFDHFSKLNSNVRKDIKKNIKNTWSPKKHLKQEQTEEDDGNDSAKEDKKQISSSFSNEVNRDIRNNDDDMETAKTARKKKKHGILRDATKQKLQSLNKLPAKNTIKLINQEDTTKKVKLEPLSKVSSENKKNKVKDLIPFENFESNSNSFKSKERKVENKRKKQNKKKTKVKKTVETVGDDVQMQKEVKRNKHKKSKANVEKTENVEDTVIVEEKTHNKIRSESSMSRPKTALQEDSIDFDKSADNRNSDTDLETNAPPHKRKHPVNRKQFNKPNVKLNLHQLSDEGMSIEYGNRRAMISDKESETENEKSYQRHKVSAEIIRKHFIKRIDNLEKQMEEIKRKIDDPPTNDDFYENEKQKTKTKAESSTELSKKYNSNVTVKTTKTKITTQSYHTLMGPEYVPNKNNISNKISSTEVKKNSVNNTDNRKTYLSDGNNTTLKEAHLTDFDYSKAAIMKDNNNNFTLPDKKTKINDKYIEEKPKISDGDKIKNNQTGLHKIKIPLDIDNEIVQNNKVNESELIKVKI